MGKIISDVSYSIRRNPHVRKIERDDILRSGVKNIQRTKFTPAMVFAFRMTAFHVNEPKFIKEGAMRIN